MVLTVLSKKEEPSLVLKTVAAQFQAAGVKVLFVSQPPQVRREPERVLLACWRPHLKETGISRFGA